MLHVLANVGQVVKNLCQKMISLSLDVQVRMETTVVNGEDRG